MEIVGAEHVPAKAPALRVPLRPHQLGAEADIVEARDVPARMVQAGPAGFRECDHVMVARMRAVQERDEVAGAVGEPQAEHFRVESGLPGHVGREQQHVRQASRPDRRGGRAAGCGGLPGRDGRGDGRRRFRRRRDLRPDDDLERGAVRIADPDAAAVGQRMRFARAGGAQPPREPLEILVVGAEAQVLQPLRAAVRVHAAPAMRVAVRVQVEAIAVAARIEPEGAVEALGRREVGHAEREAVERMHAERVRAPDGGG